MVVLFNNHGDRKLNTRILQKLGYNEHVKAVEFDFKEHQRHYCLINKSAELNNLLRVCTNLFCERGKYIEFY